MYFGKICFDLTKIFRRFGVIPPAIINQKKIFLAVCCFLCKLIIHL